MIGGIVVVLVLAGATFVAARMLSAPDAPVVGGGGELVQVVDGGSGPVQIGLRIEPAAELPQTPPETAGLFVRREDNSIFVGTGDIEVSVEVDGTGQRTTSADFSGPVLEVVVTRDTVIYRDTTKIPDPSEGQSGEVIVQQVIEAVESPEELGADQPTTEIQVWGSRSGDRIVAEVLIYRLLDS
jgi:hypothetical protein